MFKQVDQRITVYEQVYWKVIKELSCYLKKRFVFIKVNYARLKWSRRIEIIFLNSKIKSRLKVEKIELRRN